MPIHRLLLATLFIALLVPAAHAARPMITDDARITDPGACQLETWAHLLRTEKDFWALPACNFSGNFEFTAGGALARHDGTSTSGAFLVQGKTLFRPLTTNDFGIGLAAGYATHTGSGQSGAPYFYIPASLSLADDRVVLHLNIGALRERDLRASRATWGVGSELQATERLFVIAETYGQHADKGAGSPFVQLGLRYWVVPGHVQIDTTWGSRVSELHAERWFSIGLRLLSPRLFH